MNIIVTGAGLIGTYTAKLALSAGHAVTLVDIAPNEVYIQSVCGTHPKLQIVTADILNWQSLNTLNSFAANVLVHTAGVIGEQVNANPHRSIEVNVMGSVNMLELCHTLSIPKLVHLSSFGVYDRDHINAPNIAESAPLGRDRLYGACKVSIEQLLNALSKHYQIPTLILRPAAVFGHGHFTGGSGVGIAMADLVAQIIHSDTLTLERQNFPDNEYIYCEEVARAILLACDLNSTQNQVFNIGTGTITSLDEIAQTVSAAFPNKKVTITGTLKEHPKQPLEIEHTASKLGFKNKVSLAEALKEYVQIKKSNSTQ